MSLLHIFEKQMDKITMVESATDNSKEDVLCNSEASTHARIPLVLRIIDKPDI